MRTAPSPGPATSTAVSMPCGDVVGVDQQRGVRRRAPRPGARTRRLVVVQQREGVRGRARRRDAVAASGLEVRRGREPGEVRRPRRGDRRLLVGAPRPHLDDRPPGRPRTTMRAAAEAIAQSWLRIDSTSVSSTTALGERAARPSGSASRGSTARPRGSRRCRRRTGSSASQSSVASVDDRRRSAASSVVAEPEPVDRLQQPRRCPRPPRTAGRRAAAGRTPRTRTAGRAVPSASAAAPWSARTGRSAAPVEARPPVEGLPTHRNVEPEVVVRTLPGTMSPWTHGRAAAAHPTRTRWAPPSTEVVEDAADVPWRDDRAGTTRST